MALNEEDKVRIRDHLGFHNVSAVQTFVLGTPAALETAFIIEGAMNRVLVQAEGLVREILGTLDNILRLKVEGLELLQINRIDEIEINSKNQAQLDVQYDFWRGKLCNAMGIYPNPFDKAMGGGGMNVPVVG